MQLLHYFFKSNNKSNHHHVGTYTLMEAPDQDYIFYRGFGDNSASSGNPPIPPDHALYTVKTMSSFGCSFDFKDSIFDGECVNTESMRRQGAEDWASPPQYIPPADPDNCAFK